MTKTLAEQYKDLMSYCDSINDFSKVLEVEEKYVILDSTSKIVDWISICRIFIDGSVYGWSDNFDSRPRYHTQYNE